jgi:hypothetical protein
MAEGIAAFPSLDEVDERILDIASGRPHAF